MMKKVLYGVALTLFAGVSVGSLQSCKDDVADLRTQTSYDLTKLRSDLNGEAARLEGLINAEAIARQADIAAVNNAIGDLQEADEALARRIDGIDSRIDGIDQLLQDSYATKEYVDGQCEALAAEIEALAKLSDEGDAALVEMIENAQKYAEWLDAALKDEIEAELDEIRDEIVKIENAIDSIIQHLDKQVTGIIVQGTYSPVFGDFSLPIGVRSNILFNWYGENVWNEEVEFPSASETYSATGNPGLDLAKVAPAETYKVPAGYFGDADGNQITLGKVYTTLNPVGAKFDELVVNLETSAGTALPWTVALTPSDYELKFGYTRSEEDGVNDVNGFYEGALVVPVEEAIEGESAINVKIEDGLKTSMKDALKNPNMTTAKALVKAVYDQLSGKLPAYALRYNWNTPGIALEVDPGFSVNAYSVLSKYELAVATAKPLSYNFLAGYAGSEKLPTFGHMQNLINKIKDSSALNFKLDPVTVDGINIDFSGLTIDVTSDEALQIRIPDVYVDNNGTATKVTIIISSAYTEDKLVGDEWHLALKGYSDLQNAIENGVKKAIDEAGVKISSEMQAQLQKQINKIIDNINSEIEGKINNAIDDAASKLEPYFGKIDKAIDIYNKVANKLNKFFKNPNAYLQVAAFYDMGNSYGLVSGKASDPTPFVGNGQAFKLYLSSYTGELIVPACKKYVAITGAPAGVDLKSVNTGDLNKVLDGNVVEVEVARPSKAGVYEFTYQALDYSGYTSTKKFYIEVK